MKTICGVGPSFGGRAMDWQAIHLDILSQPWKVSWPFYGQVWPQTKNQEDWSFYMKCQPTEVVVDLGFTSCISAPDWLIRTDKDHGNETKDETAI